MDVHPWPAEHQQEGDLLAEVLSQARQTYDARLRELNDAKARFEREHLERVRDLVQRAHPDLDLPQGAVVRITHSSEGGPAALVIEARGAQAPKPDPEPPTPSPAKPKAKQSAKPKAKPKPVRKKRTRRTK